MKNKKPITDWDKFREQFVRWTLRRASFRWPPRGEAMKLAREYRGLYKCAICYNVYKTKEVRVDHVEPVVPVSGVPEGSNKFIDLGRYVYRMFPEASGLQVLCLSCHTTKTTAENTARREFKKRSKG